VTDFLPFARPGVDEAMIAAVEQSLGRQVFSFMSANDLRRNMQVEVFVLHPNAT